MFRIIGVCAVALATSTAFVTPVMAQSREYCTGVCGGREGGEAANPPHVVACFRKCMGEPSSSNNPAKGRKTKQSQ